MNKFLGVMTSIMEQVIHYLGPVLATKGVSITKNTQRNILQKKKDKINNSEGNNDTKQRYMNTHLYMEINK